MNKEDLEKLETIAAELFELRTKAQTRINKKLNQYERLGRILDKILENGAYKKTKDGSDYFFTELNRINNELDEIIESYKK
ncbi:MAG: hypothetical protein V1914_04810 [archaeon]